MSESVQSRLKEYLNRMKVKYIEKETRFLIPSKVGDKSLVIVVNIDAKWIDTWVRLIRAAELPVDLKKEDFYARLLLETLYMKEVTYGLTKNGDVLVHAEIRESALSFEAFRSEFGSVVFGAQHFIETIMQDYPKIEITKEPPPTLWEPG